MFSDDLSSLFAPAPASAQISSAYRIGRLLSFDPSTGDNLVVVGQATLTNLPMLLTGTEVFLAAGDAVVLLIVGNSYLIVGRVAVPGSADFGMASSSYHPFSRSANNFAVDSSNSSVVSTTVTVPNWSNNAIFITSVNCSALNNSGVDCDYAASIVLNGVSSGEYYGYAHAGSRANSVVLDTGTQTVTPGQTLTIEGHVYATSSWTATSGNVCVIAGTVIFRKV